MTPFDLMESKLRADMVQGNMHACLRDVGRLAGGYAASGALGAMDLHRLGELAESLSVNRGEGRAKWDEAVVYGRNQPVAWEPPKRDEELDWSATIGGGPEPSGKEDYRVVRAEWIQDEEIPEPGDQWHPVSDLTRYLTALFDAEDLVGYVTEAYYHEDAQRWLPKRGCYDRTAGQLIQELGKSAGDVGAVLGDTNDEVGAWIRFNALDGSGVRDSNVTRFRFALVECDNIPVPRQMALIKELELPVAALVHSGGKSLHAIVRVEADDLTAYKERVDFLYEVCGRNGLTMDRQNRNPSRLSRMPGILRKGRKQWLVDTNIGKPSWAEWKNWIEDLNDDLPEIATVEIGEDEPPLAPAIIEGVLREGHKLLLAGPSKAGKSFALIQLAIAMAEGSQWFGWPVRKGRCLYVNLELDAKSCAHRFWSIYQKRGEAPSRGQVDVWNLRGNATALDKLTPKLIRRAEKKGYQAVIIDPIYKVLTGDENSAAEMAAFCNHFDRICLKLGVATIYCHHHSKGAQGQKSSRDRSSGSGVFARDPDAILDLIELQIDKARREQVQNRWECDAMREALDAERAGWDAEASPDDLLQARLMEAHAKTVGMMQTAYRARMAARAMAKMASGWRVETTLREFPTAPARNLFFRYPIHTLDTGDLLKDAKAEGEEAPWEAAKRAKEERVKADREEREKSYVDAVKELSKDGTPPSVEELAEHLGRDPKTVKRNADKMSQLTIKGNLVIIKK